MNVITANRFLFGMLFWVLTALIITTPLGAAGPCVATFSTIVFLGVLFPDTVRKFLQDPRFKTLPSWKSAIALTGLELTITFGLIFFWVTLIALYFPDYLAKLESMALDTPPGTPEQVFMFIGGAIFVPFYEEFVFRGVVLRAYERARSPIYAAVLTALIFALVHGTIVQLLAFVPGSFLAARAVQKRGSWWLALIPHGINNGLIFGVFPFLPQEVEEEIPSLFFGIIALGIAILAFTIAARWLQVFTEQEGDRTFHKQEKIWTPALIGVVLFGVGFTILTTFAPLEPDRVSILLRVLNL